MQLTVRELVDEEYPLWDRLVATSPQGTVFAQRWWMEIVTHGGLRLLGCFAGETLLAGLPIWPVTTMGVRRLRQPVLSPYWGPILSIEEADSRYTSRLSAEVRILTAFTEALSAYPDITMQFHPTLLNWLPFYWNGYAQTTRYTYRIEKLADFPLAEKNSREAVRRNLRKAREAGLRLVDMIDPQTVAKLYVATMMRQGLPGSEEILHIWPTLSQAALERRCLWTTAVIDPQGNIHSARAMVWDHRCAYGFFSGNDLRARGSSGGTLALWHELETAATLVDTYDFEGSMLEPVERFYRHFGGELCQYYLVTRAASTRLNAMRALRHGLQTGKHWLRRRRAADAADADNTEMLNPAAA